MGGPVIDTKAEWDRRGRPYAHFYVSSARSSTQRPRWARAGFTLGPAPGSNGVGRVVHLWRSWGGYDGRDGWNLRFLHSFRRPCLTFLLHWRIRTVAEKEAA